MTMENGRVSTDTPVRVKFSHGPGITMRIKHEASQFEFQFVRQVEIETEEACGQPVKKTGRKKGTSLAYEVKGSSSQDNEDVADKLDGDLA